VRNVALQFYILELGASYTIVRGRTFDCFRIIKASNPSITDNI